MAEVWRDLSERERLLIIIGGGLAIFFVVFQFILIPIIDWRGDQRQRMERAKNLYALVAEAAPRGGVLTAADTANAGPVRNIVSQSASGAGVTIVYINARTDAAADANIAATSPDALYTWLAELRREHAIIVDNADIARETGNPEVVRAQLSLSRGGG